MYFFQCREVCGLAIASSHTSLHWRQYMICCHITHNNGRLIILIREFSLEQYVLPDDDMRCTIETCRSSESVLTFWSRNFTFKF